MKSFLKKFVRRQRKWSIGIYLGESPFNFYSPINVNNPVLTAKDVTDVSADFVADPFMVRENVTWYMFFEVLNSFTNKGEIGLASSTDGFSWDYKQIVIDEPFHLSYPYVFQSNDEYYMVPESHEANSIRLYKAVDFPTEWVFVKNLLHGRDYVDSSIFLFNGKLWLFTTSTKSNILHLYYTDDLMEDWIEHPQSPVIENDARIARPGGRVVVFNDRIIRYTQDDEFMYGTQVRAFEITQLTTTKYEEKEVGENPIIKASGSGWNKTGMHNIDPHKFDGDKWIACLDGYRRVLVFGLKFDRSIFPESNTL
jgi:hypothetical protein